MFSLRHTLITIQKCVNDDDDYGNDDDDDGDDDDDDLSSLQQAERHMTRHMTTLPSQPSTQAQPTGGQLGRSDGNDDDDCSMRMIMMIMMSMMIMMTMMGKVK